MNTILKRTLALAMVSIATAWAGALYVEVGNPDGNPEAKTMKAALIAKVTACHEPAKSKLTANLVRSSETGELRRTPLSISPLRAPGEFAVVGAIPPNSLIEIGVTNPQFPNYEPRVLVRNDAHGLQWANARRFFSKPPTESEVKSFLRQAD